jgi:hypothetical protein
MMPDRTVTQSLVPVVSGIRIRSEVSNVALEEGTPAAWLVAVTRGRTRVRARIPLTTNWLLFVFILLFLSFARTRFVCFVKGLR